VDRDVTFERKAIPGELIPHPEQPGQWVRAGDNDWVDVPAGESGKVYNEEFKKAALDGASDATKEKFKDMPADKFAKRFDQTVTDRLASDAYGRGPMDLETAVKNPAGKFSDPAGMGKTAEYKSNEWFERAERDARTPAEHETYVAEGMRQATKQYQNQVGGRLKALNATRGPGTDRPHLAPIEPPPKLAQAMEIMNKVQDGTLSPSAADAQLRVMNTTRSDVARDLGDFIKKLYTIEVPKAATPTGSQ
jgi:hypothetical protein